MFIDYRLLIIWLRLPKKVKSQSANPSAMLPSTALRFAHDRQDRIVEIIKGPGLDKQILPKLLLFH